MRCGRPMNLCTYVAAAKFARDGTTTTQRRAYHPSGACRRCKIPWPPQGRRTVGRVTAQRLSQDTARPGRDHGSSPTQQSTRGPQGYAQRQQYWLGFHGPPNGGKGGQPPRARHTCRPQPAALTTLLKFLPVAVQFFPFTADEVSKPCPRWPGSHTGCRLGLALVPGPGAE